jgi:hypothetical protein
MSNPSGKFSPLSRDYVFKTKTEAISFIKKRLNTTKGAKAFLMKRRTDSWLYAWSPVATYRLGGKNKIVKVLEE